jgi:hypothetical protein
MSSTNENKSENELNRNKERFMGIRGQTQSKDRFLDLYFVSEATGLYPFPKHIGKDNQKPKS